MAKGGIFNDLAGPVSDTGYVRRTPDASGVAANTASFMPDPDPETVGGQAVKGVQSLFDNANAKTPMETLTGKSFTNVAALKTNVGTLASGGNAAGNVQSMGTTAGVDADLNEAKGAFVQELETTQNIVMEAMECCAGDLGLDMGQVNKSFNPPPARSEALTAAVGAVVPVTGVYEIRSMMVKNLHPEDEARLAEQVAKSFQPLRDANGEVLEGPRVANNFNHDYLEQAKPQELVQLWQDILRPAEEHPEMVAFNAMEEKLDHTLDNHVEHNDLTEATLAVAQEQSVAVADIHMEDVIVAEPDALAEMRQDWPVSGASVELAQLPPAFAVNDPRYDVGDGLKALLGTPDIEPPPAPAYEPPPMQHDVGLFS